MQPRRRGSLDGTSSDNGMEQWYSIKGQQTHMCIYVCNDTVIDDRADKTYHSFIYIYIYIIKSPFIYLHNTR